MDSEERKEIEALKAKQTTTTTSQHAQANNINSAHLETSLMEEEMNKMVKQQKYALDREVSGRNVINEANASKWQDDEIDHEMVAMNQQFRRLSQASLTIDDVQEQAQKTMEEFRKMS